MCSHFFFLLTFSKTSLLSFVSMLPPALHIWLPPLLGSHQIKEADCQQPGPHTKQTREHSAAYRAPPCSGLLLQKGAEDRQEDTMRAEQHEGAGGLKGSWGCWLGSKWKDQKYGRLLLQLRFWQFCDCRWLRAQYMTGTNSYLEEQGKGNTVYFTYNLTHHNQIC